MTSEKEQILFERYPILYTGKDQPITCNLMAFGFECGDGWFDLLDTLSSKIEEYNKTAEEDKRVVAMQVKEKYGGLRFYTNISIIEVDEWIKEAERLSDTTCESCGKSPAYKRGSSWITTLCDECNDSYVKELEILYGRTA